MYNDIKQTPHPLPNEQRLNIKLDQIAHQAHTFVQFNDGNHIRQVRFESRVWRTMHHFAPNTALIVLCDREYALDTVVRNRAEFKG